MTAPGRYRVWCLSWEDDEEAGSDVVSYDIMNHDYSKRERGVVYVPTGALGSATAAAEAYADYAHDQRDGNECDWPLVFRVRCVDGTTCDFEVDRRYVTEFRARALKPPHVEVHTS